MLSRLLWPAEKFGAEPPVAIVKFISPKLFIISSRLFFDIFLLNRESILPISVFRSYIILS